MPAVLLLFTPLVNHLRRRGRVPTFMTAPLAGLITGIVAPLTVGMLSAPFVNQAELARLLVVGVYFGWLFGLVLAALVVAFELLRAVASRLGSARAPGDDDQAWRGPAALTVLYNPGGQHAQRLARWLKCQSSYIQLDTLPAGGPLARAAFPELDHDAARYELHVVAADGRYWSGPAAWLTPLVGPAAHARVGVGVRSLRARASPSRADATVLRDALGRVPQSVRT